MKSLTIRRIELITKIIKRIRNSEDDTDKECNGYLQDAVRELISYEYCNTKFDPWLLLDRLAKDGWTSKDIEYFGFSDIFKDEGQEE